MKNVAAGMVSALACAFALQGCVKMLGKDCENTETCPSGDGDGDGDGDLGGSSSGGTGDGDGDGDGDTGGTGTGGTPLASCEDLACEGTIQHCDEESPECVQCLENEHCTEPTASLCDEGECTGCNEHTDCAHLSETPACDPDTSACVACTPETEEEHCGLKSCDPDALECGPHDRGTRGTCRSCVSDSDCQTNHRCVPMQYPVGTPRAGGYCLAIAPPCNDRPYTVGLTGRISLSGVAGSSYCGINEDLTTCEAVRSLEGDWHCDRDGPGDGQCWPPGGTVADAVEVPGALCRTVGFTENRCTYACSVDSHCLASGAAGDTCGPGVFPDPLTPDYCGGQSL